MKNTELRIGNHIQRPNGTVLTVYELEIRTQKTSSINDITFDNRCIDDFFHPIPLTEEWLLKFHPNALDLSNQIFRVGRFKLIWKFAYNYWYIVDDITGCYMTKLDFVHEWQNFWHIMNGEELTLKK